MLGTSSEVSKFWHCYSSSTLDVWSYCLAPPCASSAFEKEKEDNAENEKYHARYHASNYCPEISIGGASGTGSAHEARHMVG